MCISAEALAAFLSLLAAPMVTSEPGVITVAATEGNVEWVQIGDTWCTQAPQMAR